MEKVVGPKPFDITVRVSVQAEGLVDTLGITTDIADAIGAIGLGETVQILISSGDSQSPLLYSNIAGSLPRPNNPNSLDLEIREIAVTREELNPSLRVMGTLIKQRRLATGQSLRDIAPRLGISPSYLSMLERAEHPRSHEPVRPSFQLVTLLASTLGIELGDLAEMAGYQVRGVSN